MSRLLKITDNGNGILVQGTDNILYPDNATLTFPYNSIILVTDESDIATFRSASNNDVLFSGLIGNIEIGSATVTKANIIEKFDEIANQESGGGEPFDPTDYYTKSQTNALLDGKADTNDIPTDNAELANGAGYITNSALNGYATEQWVQNQGYLTEHQSLENYYTKSETEALIPNVDNYFDGAEYDSNTKRINFKHTNTIKAYIDATAFIKDGMIDTVAISNGNLVITFNTDAGKQPISIPLTDIFNPANYYDKTASDQRYAQISSLATVATSGSYNDLTNTPTIPAAQVNSDWNASSGVAQILNKPDLSVYAQSANLATVATSGDYDDLSNKPTIPVVPTNVSAFTNDAGYLTEHQSLTEYYTKTQSDARYVDKATFDEKEEVISTALNDLNDNKQDTLTAGTNITIQNNVISASGAAAQIQSDWAQNDSNSVDFIKNKPDLSVYAQSSSLSTVATSGDYDDLLNKPTIPTVPTNVSAFTNDAGYVVSSSLSTVATSGDYDDLLNKPTIPTVPTNVSAFTNDAGYLTQHQSLTEYYTKTQSDTKYLDKATFDVKEEVISTALNALDTNKQDTLTAGTNITIQNNVISATGGTQVQADWNETDTSDPSYIQNKPTIPDVSEYVEKSVYNQKEIAIANALTDLNEKKADKTDVPNMTNYYTKTQTDSAISTAVGQIDLSGYMTTSAFDVKEETISAALNVLDERIGNINTILASI